MGVKLRCVRGVCLRGVGVNIGVVVTECKCVVVMLSKYMVM